MHIQNNPCLTSPTKKNLLYFSAILIVLELLIYKDFIFGKLLFIAKDMGDDGYIQVYPYATARMEAWINHPMVAVCNCDPIFYEFLIQYQIDHFMTVH
jgi:hypothetical protein